MSHDVKPWSETDRAAIREQLARMIDSPPFAHAERQRRFLSFIIEETLAGRGKQLKGYSIGVEVFDRPSSFDPTVEPIVRVEAGRLRTKLNEYYKGAGADEAVEIELPKGAYMPVIRLRHVPQTPENSVHVSAIPDKPSLAVLPFVNVSADAEQGYFADGITDDIITDLSKLSGLFVISRHSSFAYKGTDKRSREIADALGVRYLLEGSVRRASTQVRISSALIDTDSDSSIWAERYDREVKDIFAVQDDVTRNIISALKVRLTGLESDRLGHEGTDSIEAHDLLLRGFEPFWQYTREGCAEAQGLFRRAVEMDPYYAAAHAWLARCYVFQYLENWAPNPEESMAPARVHALRAVELDDLLPLAHAVLGWAYFWSANPVQAITEGRRACALDPNSSDAYFFLSVALTTTGRAEEGLRCMETGIRLNPHPFATHFFALGYCYFGLERYEDAIAAWRKGIAANPMFIQNHRFLAITYALLGQEEEMRAEVEIVRRVHPERLRTLVFDTAMRERVDKGTRLAGLETTDVLQAGPPEKRSQAKE